MNGRSGRDGGIGRGFTGGNNGRSGIGRGLGISGTFGRGGSSGLLFGRYIAKSPRWSRLAPGHARGARRRHSVLAVLRGVRIVAVAVRVPREPSYNERTNKPSSEIEKEVGEVVELYRNEGDLDPDVEEEMRRQREEALADDDEEEDDEETDES